MSCISATQHARSKMRVNGHQFESGMDSLLELEVLDEVNLVLLGVIGTDVLFLLDLVGLVVALAQAGGVRPDNDQTVK